MSAANWVPREPSAAERPEAPPVHPSWRRILSVVGWAHPRHKRTDLIFARQGLPTLAHCCTRGQPHQHGHRSAPWAGLPTRRSVAVAAMSFAAGDACASRRLGLLLQRESTTFLRRAGGPGADMMRCATLATVATSLLLAGCANGWFPSPIPLFPSPKPPSVALTNPRAPLGADCSATPSAPFGSGVDTSSLSQLIDDPARNNPAAQSCAWEKGTRVSYGSPTLTTGALTERK
jgi:hypothetical protein